MKRKMCGLLVLSCVMMLLSGCRMYFDYTVNDDGTVTATSKTAYTPEEAEYADTTGVVLETLEDGKQYYVVYDEPQTAKIEEVKDANGMLTEDIFIYRLGSAEEQTQTEGQQIDMYLQMSVTLLSDVVETNANVSCIGKTATFSSDGQQEKFWYAYTQKGKELVKADVQAPKMTGAKNKKYYKKMPGNIQFTDNIAIGEIRLNNKLVFAATSSTSSNGKTTTTTIWQDSNGKDASKNGKNTLKVTDIAGNTATYIIYIDKKTPTVKGVKNNQSYKKKATVYIKDNLKLSKITIGGKKQKMTKKQLVKKGKYKGYYKYTVKKKGTNKIVVTDKAGNKKTLKIKIK